MGGSDQIWKIPDFFFFLNPSLSNAVFLLQNQNLKLSLPNLYVLGLGISQKFHINQLKNASVFQSLSPYNDIPAKNQSIKDIFCCPLNCYASL